LALSSAAAGTGAFEETFETTSFRDDAGTTADWDTTATSLRLHRFDPVRLGGANTPGSALDVVLAGEQAFVADGASGLRVIDVRAPESPILLGGADTPGTAEAVAVSGNFAFVADGSNGLVVLSVTNPAGPSVVGSLDTPGTARDVDVRGNVAYVADGSAGLAVIDVTSPSGPALAGTYNTPGIARACAVAGDLAYIADGTNGLVICSVATASPALVATLPLGGDATAISLDGDRVCVATSLGLAVVSVADTAAPILLGSLPLSGAVDVDWSGRFAYVALGGASLAVVDLTIPAAPVVTSTVPLAGSGSGVLVEGERAYATTGLAGLDIVSIGETRPPTPAGRADTPDLGNEVEIAGRFAFVASGSSGLRIFDVSDPLVPALVSVEPVPSLVQGLALSGQHVVLANFTAGFRIIDVTNPTNPWIAGTLDTPGTAWAVDADGDHAFIADGAAGLAIVSFANPLSPVLVSSIDTPGDASGVAVDGNHVFVADGASGLRIFDVTNVAAPVLRGVLDTPGSASDVAVSGNLAFIADIAGGLRVVDVTNPAAPVARGFVPTPGSAVGVHLHWPLVYVADFEGGVTVVDASSSSAPFIVSTTPSRGYARDIAVSGEIACASNDEGLDFFFVSARGLDPARNAGQSVTVAAPSGTIARVRLSASTTDSVRFEISADGGSSWALTKPDALWRRVATPGTDLRWRTSHVIANPLVNPACDDLSIEWIPERAEIDSIADVPADEGGWARLHFTRSGYDFSDETTIPVTGYSIYRRIDARVATLDPVGSRRAAAVGRNLERADELLTGDGFPPGTWKFLSFVPALQVPSYVALVPTFGDSTLAGPVWTSFFVAAHTTVPSIWFASPPDSGYSIDNLPPAAPTNLHWETATRLAWNEAPEVDAAYYRVYGSSTAEFSSAELLFQTPVPEQDVAETPYAFYHVTTSDDAGNESAPTRIESPLLGAPQAPMPGLSLSPGAPNPFRGVIRFALSLPAPAFVSWELFDAAGRRVAARPGQAFEAGERQIVLDVPRLRLGAGTYFVRLRVGDAAFERMIVALGE